MQVRRSARTFPGARPAPNLMYVANHHDAARLRALLTPVVALLMVCCRGKAASHAAVPASDTAAPATHLQTAAQPIRGEAAGLFGVWIAEPDATNAGDTLVLAPDSVARGWYRLSGLPPARVTRWWINYLSKEPQESRRDVFGHTYQDGGDVQCTFHPDSTCVSAPVFCLAYDATYTCLGFKYRAGDSLFLSDGARYVRARTGVGR